MSDDLAYKLSESISSFCRVIMKQKTNIPIRSSEMGVLIFITRNPGVLAVDISEYFGIRKSSISSIISALENQGYIKRTISKEDKRISPLYPTQKGIELTDETFTEYLSNASLIIDELGREKCEEFLDMLETIIEKLQNGG